MGAHPDGAPAPERCLAPSRPGRESSLRDRYERPQPAGEPGDTTLENPGPLTACAFPMSPQELLTSPTSTTSSTLRSSPSRSASTINARPMVRAVAPRARIRCPPWPSCDAHPALHDAAAPGWLLKADAPQFTRGSKGLSTCADPLEPCAGTPAFAPLCARAGPHVPSL